MNNLYKDFITVIKNSILGKQFVLSDSFDMESAFKLAKRHSVVPLFYYGLNNSNIEKDNQYLQDLFMLTCKHISVSEHQMFEIEKLFNAFDEEKIDYMPLKGALLKKMYPKPEMRTMGDADILIKTEQYEKIKQVVEALGYEEITESDHEFIWNKTGLHLELHKRLIPSYNKDYYSYFGDGWNLAKLCDKTRYSMTAEDQMIYIFTHFAKHYRDAGIGIKHLVDIWVYRFANKNLDENYIIAELKKLQLDVFYKNILDTVDVWFNDGVSSEITDLITEVIFDSGVYGTHEAHVLSAALKEKHNEGTAKKARSKTILNRVFLPYKSMCSRYPILLKMPILLPLMWVVRWIEAVLFRRKNIGSNLEDLSIATAQNIDGYQSKLNFVGLDFNFKQND